MDLIDSQTSRVLSKALDGSSKRHMAIASNIANAETPGFKGMHVDFEENLKQAIEAENSLDTESRFLPVGSLKTTSDKHYNPNPIPQSTAQAAAHVERTQFLYRYDQNGVDIEMQMSEMAKNSQRYMALSRLEGKMFSSLKNVIKGGGA